MRFCKESLIDDIKYRKSLRQVFDPVTPTYVCSSPTILLALIIIYFIKHAYHGRDKTGVQSLFINCHILSLSTDKCGLLEFLKRLLLTTSIL